MNTYQCEQSKHVVYIKYYILIPLNAALLNAASIKTAVTDKKFSNKKGSHNLEVPGCPRVEKQR